MKNFLSVCTLLTFFMLNTSFAQKQVLSQPKIITPVQMGISQPVRDIPPISEKDIKNLPQRIVPLHTPFLKKEVQKEIEGSLQNYMGPTRTTAITTSFDGIGASGYAPPDPNGDVGPNHYVQMVNARSQIWDKSGSTLAGPFNNIDFWSGLIGPWSGTNDGDPIVLYDDLADRWMVSQLALPYYPDGPFYELIAVSTTSDPTGAYYQYAFEFPDLPDYPKFGVWPDGYYMSANVFASGTGSYIGTYAAVFDRNAMLAGSSATALYFSLSTSYWSFLPSDCDGAAPPVGAPNYFLETYAPYLSGNTDLDVYEFHVDWATPNNSTFTGPLLLSTPSCTYVNGIPQLGTATLLDDLSDRPMNRLQYRNFGSHQSMVVCQTVDAGSGRAGMRWWELRKSIGNWGIYQEGTYAPADGLYRWMGSIAMNSNGDIALGYSVSSSGMYPDIRYTGRLSTDPLGVMTVEETIIKASGGAQTNLSRWGDYTEMTVDPTESNTFWYTNQYQPTTGSFNWKTRIAAFQLGTVDPFVTLDKPNGGENWKVGSQHKIDWLNYLVDNVKLEYSTNNGTDWLEIIASTPGNDQSYEWNLPNTPSDQCKVKISDVSNSSVFDVSNNTFTIRPFGIITEQEPNDIASEAMTIAIDDTVDGSISPESDIDYYKFTGEAGDTVVIDGEARNSSDLAGLIMLFDENGNQLRSYGGFPTQTIVYVLQNSGIYYIRYTNWNNYGNYPNIADKRGEGKRANNEQKRLAQQNNKNLAPSIALSGDYRLMLTYFKTSAPVFLYSGTEDLNYNSTRFYGSFYPNGLNTTVTIDYGLTTSYGNSFIVITNANSLDSWYFDSDKITGLQANTPYHYKVTLQNSLGTVVSDDYTFSTPPAPDGWVHQNSGNTNWLPAVDFIDANNGFVVGSGYGNTILKTTDGGNNWTNVCPVNQNPTFYGYSVDMINTNKIVAAGSGLVLMSEDGGANWTQKQVSNCWQMEVSFSDANNGFLVNDCGEIYKTTDGGNNWVQLTNPITSSLVAVTMLDVNTIIAAKLGLVGNQKYRWWINMDKSTAWDLVLVRWSRWNIIC